MKSIAVGIRPGTQRTELAVVRRQRRRCREPLRAPAAAALSAAPRPPATATAARFVPYTQPAQPSQSSIPISFALNCTYESERGRLILHLRPSLAPATVGGSGLMSFGFAPSDLAGFSDEGREVRVRRQSGSGCRTLMRSDARSMLLLRKWNSIKRDRAGILLIGAVDHVEHHRRIFRRAGDRPDPILRPGEHHSAEAWLTRPNVGRSALMPQVLAGPTIDHTVSSRCRCRTRRSPRRWPKRDRRKIRRKICDVLQFFVVPRNQFAPCAKLAAHAGELHPGDQALHRHR